MYKRSSNKFGSDSYVFDVKNICLFVVCNDKQPDAALDIFTKCLIQVSNKHAPIKKMTVIPVDWWGMEKLYGWEGWGKINGK